MRLNMGFISAQPVEEVVMRVYRPGGSDIDNLVVFTVGVDGTEQGATGVGRDVLSSGNCIWTLASCDEQRHR